MSASNPPSQGAQPQEAASAAFPTEPNCTDAQSPTPFTVTQPSGRIVRVVCGSTTVTVRSGSGTVSAVALRAKTDEARLMSH